MKKIITLLKNNYVHLYSAKIEILFLRILNPKLFITKLRKRNMKYVIDKFIYESSHRITNVVKNIYVTVLEFIKLSKLLYIVALI